VVDCIFEHVGLNASDFIGNAVGAADDGAEGENDSIKAGSCVIAELEVGKPTKGAVFCL
jgi:hypothetical protein